MITFLARLQHALRLAKPAVDIPYKRRTPFRSAKARWGSLRRATIQVKKETHTVTDTGTRSTHSETPSQTNLPEIPSESQAAICRPSPPGLEPLRWIYVHPLGKGSWGTVHLLQRGTRMYAVKVVNTTAILAGEGMPYDPCITGMRNEVSVHTHLREHPKPFLLNIPTGLGAPCWTTLDGFVHMVSDYCPGGSLVTRPHQFTRHWQLQQVLAETLCGLFALHDMGFIHRDLKPANIFIDERGHIAIGDFGAVLEMSKPTLWGIVTPIYMAPELYCLGGLRSEMERDSVNPALDYWSLGMIVLALIYGEQLLDTLNNRVMNSPSCFTSTDWWDFHDDVVVYVGEAAGQLDGPRAQKKNLQCLVKGFLNIDPCHRLKDPEEIKQHGYFRNWDWNVQNMIQRPGAFSGENFSLNTEDTTIQRPPLYELPGVDELHPDLRLLVPNVLP